MQQPLLSNFKGLSKKDLKLLPGTPITTSTRIACISKEESAKARSPRGR